MIHAYGAAQIATETLENSIAVEVDLVEREIKRAAQKGEREVGSIRLSQQMIDKLISLDYKVRKNPRDPRDSDDYYTIKF